MRHFPFAIGPRERDAWFDHMAASVREGGLTPEIEEQVLAYFDNAATHLINTGGS
jgi:hemoglobin